MITKALPIQEVPLTTLRDAEKVLEQLSYRVSAPCELEALNLGRQLLRAQAQRRKGMRVISTCESFEQAVSRADRGGKDEI